jgi:hypothetical protein
MGNAGCLKGGEEFMVKFLSAPGTVRRFVLLIHGVSVFFKECPDVTRFI